jgi:hypothetical protein
MQKELREHLWLFLIVATHCICALFILNIYYPEITIKFIPALRSILKTLSIAFGIIIGIKANYILFACPTEKREELFSNLLEQAGYSLIAAILLVPSLIFFAFLKHTALASYPDILDKEFASIDKFIHFGIDPWVIVHSSITHPAAVFAIGMCYNIWINIMYAFSTFQSLRTFHKFKRMQFLMTFILSWILLGNLLAYFTSSIGPCLFERAFEGTIESFNMLAFKLQNIDDRYIRGAINVQETLWNGFVEKTEKVGHAISAMPSMHVAIAFLIYLSAREIGTKNRIISFIYFCCIMIGSVMLGWHYAIDGYVSIICVWIIWQTVGWALKKDPVYKKLYEEEEAKKAEKTKQPA